MESRSAVGKNLQTAGRPILRYGVALNLLWIGRLKFENYEVENIHPLVTQSPMLSQLAARLGERKLARLIGVTEIVIGSLSQPNRSHPGLRHSAAWRPLECSPPLSVS